MCGSLWLPQERCGITLECHKQAKNNKKQSQSVRSVIFHIRICNELLRRRRVEEQLRSIWQTQLVRRRWKAVNSKCSWEKFYINFAFKQMGSRVTKTPITIMQHALWLECVIQLENMSETKYLIKIHLKEIWVNKCYCWSLKRLNWM